MNKVVTLATAKEGAHSVAYEVSLSDGSLTWNGDISKLVPAGASHIPNHESYIALIEERERQIYRSYIAEIARVQMPSSLVYALRLPDGRRLQVQDTTTIVDTKKGKVLSGFITPLSQVSEESSVGYYNTLPFVKSLDDIIKEAAKADEPGCLLRIQVVNLTTLLGWHGEPVVRNVMEDIKTNILRFTSQKGIIERISIDGFGIILPQSSKDTVQQVVNKIHHYIRNYKSTAYDEPLKMDVLMGSVYFPSWAENAHLAMEKSYIALMGAKNAFNSFYCDYEATDKEQKFSKEQINVMYYMRDAVHQDKFCLAYQPIVESKTGKTTSYECLLRVKDDEGKVSTAWPIIHVAEKTGFIDVVDHFVLEKVVQDLSTNKDLNLTFNVSNMTTDSPKWLANCTKHFSNADIAARVTIEITETAAERDLKQTAYFVASLQALGCKVALDDFGAGYTSFRQLKSLSVDMVKIDGMFILDLAENSENLLFIKTLLDFNNCYGLQTIAECVESGEVAKLLMELNVDYMQGYYFGVPNINPPWKKR